MPGFHIERVILNYLINYSCGCGQRSNEHFMMLAGIEAIAVRAQPPGKGGNIVSLNCQIQFVLRRIFTCLLYTSDAADE